MKNVLLIFGGESYEHDISIVTAFQIYKKARLDNYKMILLYVSRDGRFFVCDEKKFKLGDFAKDKFSDKNKAVKEVVFVSGEKRKLFIKTRFGLKEYLNAEVAVFACHGGEGENGRLVTYFEQNGIACSAGSSNALAVCMDKFLFKSIAKGLKLPVVAGFKISKFEFLSERSKIVRRLKYFKFPVVLKINSGGSSIGLFLASNEEEFFKKLEEAFEFNDDVIVEKFIKGAREFNLAILGDSEKYEISELDEPLKCSDVLTFADKYLSETSSKTKGSSKGSMDLSLRRVPKDLPVDIVEEMKVIAKKTFLKLGLYGVIRIDFLLDESMSKIYICEVNSIPGSLAYYFFNKNKILTNDLLEKLIDIAERNYKKTSIKHEFIVDLLSKN